MSGPRAWLRAAIYKWKSSRAHPVSIIRLPNGRKVRVCVASIDVNYSSRNGWVTVKGWEA